MARWEHPFTGLPPTHSDLFLFLRQEELLSGCTMQHIGQNFKGDRPRKLERVEWLDSLGEWLEQVEWLESFEELDESGTTWSMVRVRYEIVACWAGLPVFMWRYKKWRRDETCTIMPAASSKDKKGHRVKDWTDTDDSDY